MAKKSLFTTLCTEQSLLGAWELVKSKGAAGGIDGATVKSFADNAGQHIRQLAEQLRLQKWTPQPYLRVSIPKKNNERRHLGLLSIKDKIVQQAILTLIQPQFDRLFVNNSYGYRPQKGPVRAVRRTASICGCKRNRWVLRLDIDNFFDSVDHEILLKRLVPYITDPDILRLVHLCVKMGVVTKAGQWNDSKAGVPQGALLSPLLANFYLHPFDQFVLSRTDAYVRYADDFVACTTDQDSALKLLEQIENFLDKRLALKINKPAHVEEVTHPFEFLGVTVCRQELSLSEKKMAELTDRINSYSLDAKGRLTKECVNSYTGIGAYYGQLLPQPVLEQLDACLVDRLTALAKGEVRSIPGKDTIALWGSALPFLSAKYKMDRKNTIANVSEAYLEAKHSQARKKVEKDTAKVVAQRKTEYHRKEAQNAELLVQTPGSYIGMKQGNIIVRLQKEQLTLAQVKSLRHITVLSQGVSLSSNAINLCVENKIPVDFFDQRGRHRASIVSANTLDAVHWAEQAMMCSAERCMLAQRLLYGKLKNQANLVKYFNKYHSHSNAQLSALSADTIAKITTLATHIKNYCPGDNYQEDLMAFEAQAALNYWDYVRHLVSDDIDGFDGRHHQGATDLFNMLLNYGYSILYARVWQALLAARLNPFDSVLHVRQPGKPTFVYDVVELFRSQCVDRIVISMVQRHLPLKTSEGLLAMETRTLLTKNILERLNRYEKYRGEEMRFEQIIARQAAEIAQYVSEHKTFKPYLAKW